MMWESQQGPLKLFSRKRWTRDWLDSEKRKGNEVLFDFGRPLVPETLRLKGERHTQRQRDITWEPQEPQSTCAHVFHLLAQKTRK